MMKNKKKICMVGGGSAGHVFPALAISSRLIEKGWGKLDYAHHDIYQNVNAPLEATAVQTFYEKKFLDVNKPITYIKFQLS